MNELKLKYCEIMKMNVLNNRCIQMSYLQLTFTLPDSRISLTALTFPSSEAWMRVDSIEEKETK